MRIAIDAMGGDHAPDQIIQGALDALPSLELGDELILVGPEALLREKLGADAVHNPLIKLHDAEEVISMDDSPVEAVRHKRKSSIVKMVKLAAAGGADAIISAGNTGALVAAGVLMLKALPGVDRPGIAVHIPTVHGPFMLCDAGANVQPKPQHLLQYAVAASVYSQVLGHVVSPRVGLLNIGAEPEKGTTLVKDARELMQQEPGLNFVGFVEARDMFNKPCDVLITDGFTGNVVLKVIEGLGTSFMQIIKKQAKAAKPELLAELSGVLRAIECQYDHEEYGGAMLLGVRAMFVKVHGSTKARGICNAVKSVRDAGRHNINSQLVTRLAHLVAQ
ncbi:MAG: phosphate acyltransferase PlsX [Phycisphaerae bacterium]